jgi:hypothetical protein
LIGSSGSDVRDDAPIGRETEEVTNGYIRARQNE